MPDQFERTRMLVGGEAVERLRHMRVLLFGIGGVGSFAAEAIARAGIGRIELIDNDTVGLTNLNRQLVALHSTLEMKKTEVMAARMRDICPDTEVTVRDVFVSAETIASFEFSQYDYVIDAIDTVSAKLMIIDGCIKAGTPIISCMGTGNRLDPSKLTVCDVYKTSGDPLARVMRRELKKLGVEKLKVVCSSEEPRKPVAATDEAILRRSVPASISFVPPCAGMMLAGEAVRDMIQDLL